MLYIDIQKRKIFDNDQEIEGVKAIDLYLCPEGRRLSVECNYLENGRPVAKYGNVLTYTIDAINSEFEII